MDSPGKRIALRDPFPDDVEYGQGGIRELTARKAELADRQRDLLPKTEMQFSCEVTRPGLQRHAGWR